ncbi:MAG: hypothetical protein ACI83W_001396 [Marinoscillum sp.]|jgi:hypothetical protein
MKNLTLIAALAILAFSCGEAGIQTNVGKEVSVETPFTIPGPPVNIPLPNYNPPAISSNEEFDLEDVTSSIDDLGEVLINSISYEITGIDPSEEVAIDELSAVIALSGASDLEIFNISGTLKNTTSKQILTLTPAQKESLQDQLFNQKKIDFSVLVDLNEVPDQAGVSMTFIFYFDATVKIEVEL